MTYLMRLTTGLSHPKETSPAGLILTVKTTCVFSWLKSKRVWDMRSTLWIFATGSTSPCHSKQKRESGETTPPTTMTTPTSDFYLTLQSNASTYVYPNNGPSGFKVTLLNIYKLHGDDWLGGLASLIYLHTWVNMSGPTDEELN